ncbi:phosphate/phosphite/phosphonate ABC transporter substrate-binding protein [Pseudaestuariivita atlantica]|uniref:Phosphate ABC transporter substrate-binding protein n=1 Tax=Pseudaestuariivita atlantica TaxID=1317121 RepID=A0A0L1JVC2_9RHOB|nr:PhnD/SsuA/transferrin family substrate-binding protein [Pseudaestuariivita atlantica]KNG95343.1 hypothetical protein ATO11_01580 [Pseudaestuariivita atlantica]
MTASLPMYARPETQAATDRLWTAIRAALGHGPATLDTPTDLMAHWRDPALVLSQTCGLPYRAALHGHVDLVTTPDHALPGCPPGYYNSVLVTRAGHAGSGPEDWARMRLAVNGGDSQSGWAAPAAHLGTTGHAFARVTVTGAHALSARAVLTGAADLASVDAQTWRLLLRHEPDLRALHEAARTEPTPGLPLITALGRGGAVRQAVRAGLAALSEDDRATLDLRGLVDIPAAAYTALPLPPPLP